MTNKATATSKPIWGYSRKDSKIFHLEPDEELPEGYFDHPAKVVGSQAEKDFRAAHEAEGVRVPWDPKPEKAPAK